MSKIKRKKEITYTTELNTSQQKKIIQILIEQGEDAIHEIINNVNNGYFMSQSNNLTEQLAQPNLLKKNEYNIIKEINRINDLDEIGRIMINRLNKNLQFLPQISLNELKRLKAERERERALQSVFTLKPVERPQSPPSHPNEDTIVPNILHSTKKVLNEQLIDPFTTEREPGSGPVKLYSAENIKDVSKELDFGDGDINLMDTSNDEFDGFMDIEEEEKEKVGGKRRHRKMKTRKASRKTKSKSIIKHCSMRKNKRRRTFVKRR
jgi:hypothetical protein